MRPAFQCHPSGPLGAGAGREDGDMDMGPVCWSSGVDPTPRRRHPTAHRGALWFGVVSAEPEAVLDDLDGRGLVHDTTDRRELTEVLSSPTILYHGIDPSADSLHVGNFVGVLALRRFQDHGHRPLVLVGGATGMVGDPSGRSDERNLLDIDTLGHNVESIERQLVRFLDFGPGGATMVNNHDWTAPMSILEFLRDVGKYATVNQMVAKESVRSRMESDNGISYTEFSYMLLQAFDYWWLNENMACTLQIGGSDQWGNITAGIDLVRRRSQRNVHGLTWPLVTKTDGSKFGKSQQGNVWLDADRTSPYQFLQHWRNTDDRDVERFLMQLTLLSLDDIESVMADHTKNPGARVAQRRLGRELTELVHGPERLEAATEAADLLFGGSVFTRSALECVALEVPTTAASSAELLGEGSLVPLLARSSLCTSNSDARRALAEGSIYVNNERRTDDSIDEADLRFDRFLLLRRGKKNYNLVISAS